MRFRSLACSLVLAGGLVVLSGALARVEAAPSGPRPARSAAAAAPAVASDSSPQRRRRSDLVFPVARRDRRAVISYFGAPRDGGRRSHRGIDIAAPRGTPALAAVDGTITRVETTPLGGRVVWLKDADSDREHYYAHLDVISVRRGQRVRAGTQVGTVGNTGNAARTPPHLHYAVREGGSVLDPMRLLAPGAARLAARAPVRSAARAGRGVVRTKLNGATLRSSPGGGWTLAVLPKNAAVEVVAERGRYARVRYSGREGYVARQLLRRG